MEIPKVKKPSVSSGKEEKLKWKMVQLKKIQVQVLKRELELWKEWKTLTGEDRETRR